MPDAFNDRELEQIRLAIEKKYSQVSSSADGFFRYTVGKTGALELGYSPSLVHSIPEKLLDSFCGVGNPFAIHPIKRAATVLDFGCGGGFDLYVASTVVGESGKVVGVDLCAEMIKKAGENMKLAGLDDVELYHVESEQLPFAGETFDTIISNGAVNLCPLKENLFKEFHRLLRTGGRLQFADIIRVRDLPDHLRASVESWSD